MPELPEVHTTIEDLKAQGLVGMTITAVEVYWERTVGGNADVFTEAVTDRSITGVRRRGKFIIIELDSGAAILAHLRMSGRLYISEVDAPRSGYERVILFVARPDRSGELRFHVPRKFGRMTWAADPDLAVAHVGIEPLSPPFGPVFLARILTGRTRRLKALLLDQTIIAGLGNIYTDEALWDAGLHPSRPAGSLSPEEVDALATAIRAVLTRGIANLGTSLGSGASNFIFPGKEVQAHNQEDLRVFQRTGTPCRRCGTPIERIIVAQRSTHICPACQRYEG